jgi:excisionase family DNA binding protein
MTMSILRPKPSANARSRASQPDQVTPVTAMTGVTRLSPSPYTDQPALMTIECFMAWAQCSRWKTYELIKAKEILAVKIGSATRITRASAEAWLANLVVVGG